MESGEIAVPWNKTAVHLCKGISNYYTQWVLYSSQQATQSETPKTAHHNLRAGDPHRRRQTQHAHRLSRLVCNRHRRHVGRLQKSVCFAQWYMRSTAASHSVNPFR
jgi:hypothetical protein